MIVACNKNKEIDGVCRCVTETNKNNKASVRRLCDPAGILKTLPLLCCTLFGYTAGCFICIFEVSLSSLKFILCLEKTAALLWPAILQKKSLTKPQTEQALLPLIINTCFTLPTEPGNILNRQLRKSCRLIRRCRVMALQPL